jgi:hypothetical protein
MARTISFSVGSRLEAALKKGADQREMNVPDFIKAFFFAASETEGGCLFKLELPPLIVVPESTPLLDSAGTIAVGGPNGGDVGGNPGGD